MGHYVFYSEGVGTVIYSNHDDTCLDADLMFTSAMSSLGFKELEGEITDYIESSTIGVLHGGLTAEDELLEGKWPSLEWQNKTLFILFSSQGFSGRHPYVIAKDKIQYYITYLQKAPESSKFVSEDWQELIKWGCDFVRNEKQSKLDLPSWSGCPQSLMPEPTSIPISILSYALAVKYNLEYLDLNDLVITADIEYTERLPALKSINDILNHERQNIQNDDIFPTDFKDYHSAHDVQSSRYQTFCRAIDLLRDDI